MAVIKGCEKQEVIQTRLKDVQAAFMALLSDNDGKCTVNQVSISRFRFTPSVISDDNNIKVLCT